MKRSGLINKPKNRRFACTRTRGFTLLETLLAVAILLILVGIVYQGIVSTMRFSANTAAFEKAANEAESQANAVLSKTASLAASGTGTVILTDLTGTVIPNIPTLSISQYSAEPPPPMNYGSTPYAAAHRNVFIYTP